MLKHLQFYEEDKGYYFKVTFTPYDGSSTVENRV